MDASAFVALMLGQGDEEFRRVLQIELQRSGAYAPALWWYEAANTLMIGIRRGRHDAEFAKYVLEREKSYVIVSDRRDLSHVWIRAFDLAAQYSLTVYDASYLELAMSRGATLATLDQALIRAAQLAGVPLLQV